jgi:hypothetical protein
MYKSENTHKFPALVLAAGFTTAVVIGLSALAQSHAGMTATDTRQLIATTPSMIAPFRIDVIATRPQAGVELQAVAAGARSRQPG